MRNRALPWVLLLSLTLVAGAALALSLIEKIERDDLFHLEESMVTTARTLAGLSGPAVAEGDLPRLEHLLESSSEASSMRIRILDADRRVLADSLGFEGPQDFIRYRPEVQRAFQGDYGAYTRFSDETERSLALFVALPIYHQKQMVGAVYISKSTDEILFKLGRLRIQFRNWLIAISFALFVCTLLITGKLNLRLRKLGKLAATVIEEESDRQLDEVTVIGRGLDRLVESLRQKVSELEDERLRTRRFVEEIAHELKSPVTALQGSVEALRDEPDQKLLDNVQRETERLSHLVGLLIELQKLEYYEMRWETFELTSLMETVIESYQYSAKKKQVELELRAPEECLARGDSGKLRRVLENLVDNAVRCSPTGGRVVLELVEGPTLEVRVSDQGPGIPESEREAIFERGRGGTSVASLGLGLAVAAEVIKLHQQRLAVDSSAEGSVFRFTLERSTQP